MGQSVRHGSILPQDPARNASGVSRPVGRTPCPVTCALTSRTVRTLAPVRLPQHT